MNKEIKDQWIAALTNGEYKQTTGEFRDDKGFCCLGVLCDLHSKETGTPWEDYDHINDIKVYMSESGALPLCVQVWAGLEQSNGTHVVIDGLNTSLPVHNDKRRTFAEIAKAIDEQL